MVVDALNDIETFVYALLQVTTNGSSFLGILFICLLVILVNLTKLM